VDDADSGQGADGKPDAGQAGQLAHREGAPSDPKSTSRHGQSSGDDGRGAELHKECDADLRDNR
jgi:hypothetical protein